jgi:Na+/H+ antiporter NhaA
VATPIRAYLRTEAGSAGILVVAIVAALVWCTISPGSYESAWTTPFSLHLGHWGITRDLRTWVNSGLMTLFFLVVGLEARREFDLGDLRDRRRFILPCAAGLAGLAVPVAIYAAVVHGGPGAHGWGVAMSTDTALALGLLAMMGRRVPERARIFLVTVFVVDDVAALLVVTVVYSEDVKAMPLVVALIALVAVFVARSAGVPVGWTYAGFGTVAWFGLIASGVDPIILGLVLGLSTSAYTPSRTDLERASRLFRLFREQPTAELARSATLGLTSTLSPNSRLQSRFLTWTTYMIVPLFALANAGVHLDAAFLSDAFTSPITWGVIVGYVVGKPIAVVGASWVIERVTARRIRPDVGWAAVAGSGTIAGIGFTVSFVVAALALHGVELDEAKIGVLAAGVVAALLTAAVYTVTWRLTGVRRARALLGDADQLIDLTDPVDPTRDHIRGPAEASVTLVEYGDLQCPYCGRAEPIVRELLTDTDLRYVWRHLPLTDVHPQAQLAAEASEAASAQGRFWEMHDLMLTKQDHLKIVDLLGYARDLGLDTDQFHEDVTSHAFADRVAQDVESADLSGVSGTPTFFVNGQRHYGAYDIDTLKKAIKVARARVAIRSEPTRA